MNKSLFAAPLFMAAGLFGAPEPELSAEQTSKPTPIYVDHMILGLSASFGHTRTISPAIDRTTRLEGGISKLEVESIKFDTPISLETAKKIAKFLDLTAEQELGGKVRTSIQCLKSGKLVFQHPNI